MVKVTACGSRSGAACGRKTFWLYMHVNTSDRYGWLQMRPVFTLSVTNKVVGATCIEGFSGISD